MIRKIQFRIRIVSTNELLAWLLRVSFVEIVEELDGGEEKSHHI